MKITQLIQVCWNVENKLTHDREVHSLLKASKELNCSRLLVITDNFEGMETSRWFGLEGDVEYIPARKWLVE